MKRHSLNILWRLVTYSRRPLLEVDVIALVIGIHEDNKGAAVYIAKKHGVSRQTIHKKAIEVRTLLGLK